MKYRGALIGFVIGAAYALVCGFLFTLGEKLSLEFIEFVSIAMLIATPVSVGVITVFFATREQASNKNYRRYYPWLSVFGWALISLIFAVETLICIIMLLPLYLPLSTLGGTIGGYIRRNYCDKANQSVTGCFAFLPFILIPFELPLAESTLNHTVTNSVIIEEKASAVWSTLPTIENIKPEELGWNLSHFIGLPKPVSAHTPQMSVGSMRDLRWEKGVHFQEEITEIKENRLLAYNVHVNQESMKIAELDTHIVVGDKYFDVISGSYSLSTVGNNTLLSLSTSYRMTTNINWYGKILANFVLDDFHDSVLQLIKQRAEKSN